MLLVPFSWLMIAVATAIAGTMMWRCQRRLTQPLRGRRRARTISEFPSPQPSADRVGSSLVHQIVHDGLGSSWIRAQARIAQIGEALESRKRRVEQRRAHADRLQSELDAAASDADEVDEPDLSPRQRAAFTSMLFTGDLGVVSGAIMAGNARTSLLAAFVTAFALAVALLVFGKLLGHWLRRLAPGAGWFVTGTSAILGAFGACLLLLRLGQGVSVWAWLMLSISPALGAAGVVLLGPNADQLRVARLQRKLWHVTRRLTRAMRTLDRLRGRLSYLQRRGELQLGRVALAARSEGLIWAVEDKALPKVDDLTDELGLITGTEPGHPPLGLIEGHPDGLGIEGDGRNVA